MKPGTLLNLVEKHFQYLIDDYGFDIEREIQGDRTAFGSYLVRMNLGECSLKFHWDGRDDIITIDVVQGKRIPLVSQEVRYIFAYLTKEIGLCGDLFTDPPELSREEKYEWYFEKLSSVLLPFWPCIIRFSNEGHMLNDDFKKFVETMQIRTHFDKMSPKQNWDTAKIMSAQWALKYKNSPECN